MSASTGTVSLGPDPRVHALLALLPPGAARSQQMPADVDCIGVMASEAEWRVVRCAAVDVAEQAALLGSASGRFQRWEVRGLRLLLPATSGQRLIVAMQLLHGGVLVRSWVSEMPAFSREA